MSAMSELYIASMESAPGGAEELQIERHVYKSPVASMESAPGGAEEVAGPVEETGAH